MSEFNDGDPRAAIHMRRPARLQSKSVTRQRAGNLLFAVAAAGVVTSLGCTATRDTQPQLEAKLDELVGDVSGPIHYFADRFDLNADGRPEWIVHLAGPMVCGTGGCTTFVLAPEAEGFRQIASIPVTRPPIVVAERSSNGWRDLIVHVGGGGIVPGYDARLRYDGTAYPMNPTVPPAEPLEGSVSGEVVIPRFQSFTEGRLLRAGG